MASNNHTRTINGIRWEYCDSEGFWWHPNGQISVRRSDENQNRWLVCDGEEVLNWFTSMKKAMQSIWS